ncbi:MAG: TetR/AcrR family transcriptional regulator [Pseudomonadota bacterium]
MRERKTSSDRKAEIVEATLLLVAELGPERVTTQAVANRVGISQPGVFRHFPAKSDLWEAVADWVVEAATRRWEAALEPPGDALQDLQAVIKAQMEFIQETPAVPGLIFSQELHNENRQLRMAFDGLARRFHDLLTKLVGQAQDQGILPGRFAAEDLASLLLTLTPGLAIRWSLGGHSFHLAEKGQQLLSILLSCLSQATPQQGGRSHV